jgi:hypothetical protein
MLERMPLSVALLSFAVLFLAGIGWGWQVRRERLSVRSVTEEALRAWFE